MPLMSPSGDLISFLRGLRAIREYTSEPVASDALDDIIEVGRWTGSASNKQPAELIVVRDPGGRRLPMRTDGLTVDEDALAPEEVGSLEPGEPGSVRGLVLRLRPGRYEIFCNMAGHYMSGMHAVLLVG